MRLAGRNDERVAELAAVDGVTVTGPVDDMATELAVADVVAVPLREGAGTRIKVLEALAHRIPVVATSVAVEGLDVVAGRHLLVADEPEAFAAGCVTLLRDEPRRRALADAGAQLVGIATAGTRRARQRCRWCPRSSARTPGQVPRPPCRAAHDRRRPPERLDALSAHRWLGDHPRISRAPARVDERQAGIRLERGGDRAT